jgi:hypothetical protein
MAMKKNRIPRNGVVCVAALIPLASAAYADGSSFGVDAGVGESDNVTLVSNNKVSQTIAVADLDFSAKNTGSHLTDDIQGNFTYLDFLQNAYGRELLGHLNADIGYALIPQSLTWTVQDNWGQAQVDPFSALIPTNQQNVNYFSTGPEFYARLGGTGFLDVNARYARADYEVTPIDSKRFLGSLQLGHDLSAQSSLSLNGNAERILYDDDVLNQDYDLERVYGRYQLKGARTDIGLNLGVSRISAQGSANSGFFGEFEASRKVSPATTVLASLGRELTDASSSFNNLQSATLSSSSASTGTNNVVNNSPAPITSSVYTSDYVTAGFDYQRSRTEVAVRARWERDNYLSQTEYNGSRSNIGVTFNRKLTHAFSAQLFGNIYRNSYDHQQFVAGNGGYTDRDGYYGLALTLREGRALEFRLRLDRGSRDISNGQGVNYAEDRIFLTVGYRPMPRSDSGGETAGD